MVPDQDPCSGLCIFSVEGKIPQMWCKRSSLSPDHDTTQCQVKNSCGLTAASVFPSQMTRQCFCTKEMAHKTFSRGERDISQ